MRIKQAASVAVIHAGERNSLRLSGRYFNSLYISRHIAAAAKLGHYIFCFMWCNEGPVGENSLQAETDSCRYEIWLGNQCFQQQINTDTYIRELFQLCRSAGDKNTFGKKKKKKLPRLLKGKMPRSRAISCIARRRNTGNVEAFNSWLG